MEEKKEGGGVRRRLQDRYGDGGARACLDMIVLRGEHTATVYSCRRILLYTPTEIRLQMAKRVVSVCGEELCCTSFSGGTVTVRGLIRGLSYPENWEECCP